MSGRPQQDSGQSSEGQGLALLAFPRQQQNRSQEGLRGEAGSAWSRFRL